MPRSRSQKNGRLEEALATLIQNQASFVAQLRESDRQKAELDRQMAEWQRLAAERFDRIESILLEHNRILERMSETIREKIGFKIPTQSAVQKET